MERIHDEWYAVILTRTLIAATGFEQRFTASIVSSQEVNYPVHLKNVGLH